MSLQIMFNNQDEVDFLMNSLKSTDHVLEYGSGGSTVEIAKRVGWLYSIEHDLKWYNKVKKELPYNVTLHYQERNQEEKPGDDGTYDDYKDYIELPTKFVAPPFDVIFIDGRARVECAKVAVKLLKEDGIIFIHDYRHPQEQYRRREYEVVEEFLEPVEGVFALWKFKVRK